MIQAIPLLIAVLASFVLTACNSGTSNNNNRPPPQQWRTMPSPNGRMMGQPPPPMGMGGQGPVDPSLMQANSGQSTTVRPQNYGAQQSSGSVPVTNIPLDSYGNPIPQQQQQAAAATLPPADDGVDRKPITTTAPNNIWSFDPRIYTKQQSAAAQPAPPPAPVAGAQPAAPAPETGPTLSAPERHSGAGDQTGTAVAPTENQHVPGPAAPELPAAPAAPPEAGQGEGTATVPVIDNANPNPTAQPPAPPVEANPPPALTADPSPPAAPGEPATGELPGASSSFPPGPNDPPAQIGSAAPPAEQQQQTVQGGQPQQAQMLASTIDFRPTEQSNEDWKPGLARTPSPEPLLTLGHLPDGVMFTDGKFDSLMADAWDRLKPLNENKKTEQANSEFAIQIDNVQLSEADGGWFTLSLFIREDAGKNPVQVVLQGNRTKDKTGERTFELSQVKCGDDDQLKCQFKYQAQILCADLDPSTCESAQIGVKKLLKDVPGDAVATAFVVHRESEAALYIGSTRTKNKNHMDFALMVRNTKFNICRRELQTATGELAARLNGHCGSGADEKPQKKPKKRAKTSSRSPASDTDSDTHSDPKKKKKKKKPKAKKESEEPKHAKRIPISGKGGAQKILLRTWAVAGGAAKYELIFESQTKNQDDLYKQQALVISGSLVSFNKDSKPPAKDEKNASIDDREKKGREKWIQSIDLVNNDGDGNLNFHVNFNATDKASPDDARFSVSANLKPTFDPRPPKITAAPDQQTSAPPPQQPQAPAQPPPAAAAPQSNETAVPIMDKK